MRRVSLVMLLMLVALAGFAQEKDRKQYQAFGVAFYNLENLFDTINNNGKYDLEFSPAGARQWNGAKYRSKINRLATAIAAMTTQTTPMGPAVIGVSEIENKGVLDDLVRAEPIRKWRLQVVHHDSPDRRGVDVGLLYNPRMFRPINVTNHRLTIPGNDSFRTRDQMCVCGVMGGDTIAVIVNHWPSRLGGQERSSYLREAAADLSHSIADSLWRINPNIGVIVMGDLNDDPMDRSVARNLGARKEMKGVEPHGFYNPWWKKLDEGVGTLAYDSSWNLFDQIIVSGNLLKHNNPEGLHYWKCQVNNFDFLIDREGKRQGYPKRTYASGQWLDGYSDHFPTEIFLIKER